MTKVNVILLTWNRLNKLSGTLKMLNRQTNTNFTLYISNANLGSSEIVERIATKYAKNYRVVVRHDGNEDFAFRRFLVAKTIADESDMLIFIDDDATFSNNFVQDCINQYEPNSYKSAYCWKFDKENLDYYNNRKRVFKSNDIVHYAGTGAAVVDPKIFLDDRFWLIPEEGKRIEDLWLSFFVSHVLGGKLALLKTSETSFDGSDSVSLSKLVLSSNYNKNNFLKDLVLSGWKL